MTAEQTKKMSKSLVTARTTGNHEDTNFIAKIQTSTLQGPQSYDTSYKVSL